MRAASHARFSLMFLFALFFFCILVSLSWLLVLPCVLVYMLVCGGGGGVVSVDDIPNPGSTHTKSQTKTAPTMIASNVKKANLPPGAVTTTPTPNWWRKNRQHFYSDFESFFGPTYTKKNHINCPTHICHVINWNSSSVYHSTLSQILTFFFILPLRLLVPLVLLLHLLVEFLGGVDLRLEQLELGQRRQLGRLEQLELERQQLGQLVLVARLGRGDRLHLVLVVQLELEERQLGRLGQLERLVRQRLLLLGLLAVHQLGVGLDVFISKVFLLKILGHSRNSGAIGGIGL